MTLLAETGHFCTANVIAVTQAGIDPLLAPGPLQHGKKPPPAPIGPIPDNLTPE